MTKKKWLMIAVDLLVAIATASTASVARWMMEYLPSCPFATVGLLCPACGGTRCVRLLFSGEFSAAFAVNPLIFLLIWYLAAALALWNAGALFGVSRAERIAIRMTGWQAVIVGAVLFAAFGILRNIR